MSVMRFFAFSGEREDVRARGGDGGMGDYMESGSSSALWTPSPLSTAVSSSELRMRQLETQMMIVLASFHAEMSHPFRLCMSWRRQYGAPNYIRASTSAMFKDGRVITSNDAMVLGAPTVQPWVLQVFEPVGSQSMVELNLICMQRGSGTVSMFDETHASAKIVFLGSWTVSDAHLQAVKSSGRDQLLTNTLGAHGNTSQAYVGYATQADGRKELYIGRISTEITRHWGSIWPLIQARLSTLDISPALNGMAQEYKELLLSTADGR